MFTYVKVPFSHELAHIYSISCIKQNLHVRSHVFKMLLFQYSIVPIKYENISIITYVSNF